MSNEGWGGGGELPIRRAIWLDQCEGNHITRNLARGKGVREKREGGRHEGRRKNSGKHRVSDSREGGG
jgi:hypothetical protein